MILEKHNRADSLWSQPRKTGEPASEHPYEALFLVRPSNEQEQRHLPSSLMIRVMITSTGEHTVVAMRLAANDTATWVKKVSFIAKRLRQYCLEPSYEASCEDVINMARVEWAPTPRKSEVIPSSRVILINPSRAFL